MHWLILAWVWSHDSHILFKGGWADQGWEDGRNFDKADGEEGLPVISMSEETPDNLCIAFLDLSYCRPIASLIQVLIS